MVRCFSTVAAGLAEILDKSQHAMLSELSKETGLGMVVGRRQGLLELVLNLHEFPQ